MRSLFLVVAAAALAAGTGAAAPTSVDRSYAPLKCRAGSKPAVISGKRVCLKAGQRCERKRDGQYHRYGFHCHSGRLTRPKAAPKPPPPPPTPPLPGQKVNVGGYRLYIECAGSGTPTVVLEPGDGINGATVSLRRDWLALRAALGTDLRVCAYDRAGLGESGDRPAALAPTGARFAEELYALLGGANVAGPYVLVGESFAGLLIMSHAARYPSDYAGLVFLDAVGPCTGTACVFDSPERADFRDLGSPTFGNRPVVALTAAISDGADLSRRSTNSLWVSAPGSSHFILADRPQLVADAVRLVAAAVRTGATLPACEQTPLVAAGGRCETVPRP